MQHEGHSVESSRVQRRLIDRQKQLSDLLGSETFGSNLTIRNRLYNESLSSSSRYQSLKRSVKPNSQTLPTSANQVEVDSGK